MGRSLDGILERGGGKVAFLSEFNIHSVHHIKHI